MPKNNVDQALESLVKILNTEKGEGYVEGTGFIVREDGYLITCHHVIMPLGKLIVEYSGTKYEAEYCQEYSDPNVDVAILKIGIQDAKKIKLIDPADLKALRSDIVVIGFPAATASYKRKGTAFRPKDIIRDTPTTTIATFNTVPNPEHNNKWNCLPDKDAEFIPFKLNEEVYFGTSGGPVFIEKLNGAIGMVQSKEKSQKTAFAVSWDNIHDILKNLGIHPKKSISSAGPGRTEDDEESRKHLIEKIATSAKKARAFVEARVARFVADAFETIDPEFSETVIKGKALSKEAQEYLKDCLDQAMKPNGLEMVFYGNDKVDEYCRTIVSYGLMEAVKHIGSLLKLDCFGITEYFDENVFTEKTSPWNSDNLNVLSIPMLGQEPQEKSLSNDPLSVYDYNWLALLSAAKLVGTWVANKTEEEIIKIGIGGIGGYTITEYEINRYLTLERIYK